MQQMDTVMQGDSFNVISGRVSNLLCNVCIQTLTHTKAECYCSLKIYMQLMPISLHCTIECC